MGTRRSGRSKQHVGAQVAAGAVAVITLVLGACGSSDGDAGKVDISGLDDPASTSKGDGAPGTTTTVAEADRVAADGPDCGLLGDYLVPPVSLSEEDGGDPPPGPESMTQEEEMALSRSIGDELPADLAERWGALIDAVEAELAGEAPMDDADALELYRVVDEAMRWAAKTCPDLPPTWACSAQAKFQRVGNAIGSDGSTDAEEEEGVEDPDDVLAGLDDHDDAVVLDESETAILWGWLDEDGLVIRTEQANEIDGLWADDGASVSCPDSATGGASGSESFEVIGEPIEN